MTGSTPLYGLTYPEAADLASAVPAQMQQLAEDVESTIAGITGVPAPGSITACPLDNSWAAGADGVRVKKIGGVCYLKVHATKGSWSIGEQIAHLPSAGFHPGEVWPFGAGAHILRVYPNGAITVETAPAGGGVLASVAYPL